MQKLRRLKKFKGLALLFIGVTVMTFCVLSFAFPKAEQRLGTTTKISLTKKLTQKEVIRLVALGDSLTEGVGDSTNAGGFVPLLSQELTDKYQLNAVQTDNYGKAGNRTDQILARIKKSTKMQQSIKKADVITLTTGGNDVMKVVRNELMNGINVGSFTTPQTDYVKNLEKLYTEIRKLNKDAPIYQLGIYNPFYLSFSDITELQTIVDNWNNTSEKAVRKQKNAYFIPINDLLYKGIDGKIGVDTKIVSDGTSESGKVSQTINNLISTTDNFHPNNLGYQIMSNAFQKELDATKTKWLSK